MPWWRCRKQKLQIMLVMKDAMVVVLVVVLKDVINFASVPRVLVEEISKRTKFLNKLANNWVEIITMRRNGKRDGTGPGSNLGPNDSDNSSLQLVHSLVVKRNDF